MMHRILSALLAVSVVAGGCFAWAYLAERPHPPLRSASALQPPRALAAFELRDHEGREFTRESLRGQWNLVFIGFTRCPDVCPNTLLLLGRLDSTLREQGGTAQIIFVSVDSERDTPEMLARYVGYFSPNLLGVGGAPAQVESFTNGLGLGYVKRPTAEGAYTIEHSSSIVLIDPQARIAAYARPPFDLQALAGDLLPRTRHRPKGNGRWHLPRRS